MTSTTGKELGSKLDVDCNQVETSTITATGDMDGSQSDDNNKLSAESEEVDYSEEEEKQVRRKIDFIILPLLCGCYIFSVRRFNTVQRRLCLPCAPSFSTKLC
jgi:hypothetical protein